MMVGQGQCLQEFLCLLRSPIMYFLLGHLRKLAALCNIFLYKSPLICLLQDPAHNIKSPVYRCRCSSFPDHAVYDILNIHRRDFGELHIPNNRIKIIPESVLISLQSIGSQVFDCIVFFPLLHKIRKGNPLSVIILSGFHLFLKLGSC